MCSSLTLADALHAHAIQYERKVRVCLRVRAYVRASAQHALQTPVRAAGPSLQAPPMRTRCGFVGERFLRAGRAPEKASTTNGRAMGESVLQHAVSTRIVIALNHPVHDNTYHAVGNSKKQLLPFSGCTRGVVWRKIAFLCFATSRYVSPHVSRVMCHVMYRVVNLFETFDLATQ